MTQLFANGFESGDFSSWTGNYTQNGTSQVQSSIVNSGSYAGQFTVTSSGGYADAYKDLGSSYTTVNQRFYVRFNTLPASGQGVLLGFLANNSTNNTTLGIGLRYSGGSAKWFVGYLKAGSYTLLYSSANTPQTNTWYCLEVKAVINSSSGTVEAWINGTKDNSLCDTSGFNNTAWGNINRSFVGQDSQTEPTYPLTTYVDDVVVADTYIGPLGGSASKLEYIAGANQSVTAGSVSSVITVQVQDSNGNPVSTGATVSLSTTATSSGHFYSDSGGTNQITSLVISSGQTSADCYYKDTTAGTPTLTASATGLTSATTQFTVSSSGQLTASPPLQLSGSNFSILQANGSTDGYLSSSDWNNFNDKISTGSSPTLAALTTTGNATIGGNVTATGRLFVQAIPNTIDGITIYAYDSQQIERSTTINATTEGLMDPSKPIVQVQHGVRAEDISAAGFLGSDSEQSAVGGGAIVIGNRFTDPDDPPRVILTNAINANGSGAAATVTLTNGAVTAVNKTQSGSGYTDAPRIILTGGNPLTKAALQALLTPTSIASINIVSGGSGYSSTPTIEFTSIDARNKAVNGSGASATATLTNGVVTAIVLTSGGTGYTSAPLINISGDSTTEASAQAVLTPTTVSSIAINSNGGGYDSSPVVSFSSGGYDTLYITNTLTPLRVTRASINPFMLSHISVASMRIPFKVGANGVTANDLVSIDGNLDVIRANLNTNGTSIIGVTAQSGNQGDTVLVAISGLAQAVADGTINIGDRVSATNNNNNPGRAIRFTGTPSGQVIGKALTPTTAAGQPFGMLVSVSG